MFTLIRLGSVGGVVALRWLLHPMAYFSLFVAVLFGHYVLATIYGRHRAKPLFSGRVSIVVVLGFVAFVAVPPLLMLPPMVLFLYFGAHHALNEGYMVLGRRGKTLDRDARRLLVARVVLSFLVFVAVIMDDPLIVRVIELPHAALFVPLAIAFIAFVVLLRPVAKTLERRELVDLLSFEIAGVAIACLVFVTSIRFFDAAFYHLFVWLYMPLIRAPNLRGKLRYLVHVVVATSVFFVLMPWYGFFPALSYEFWFTQSLVWAYVHVSTSVVLSGFNPQWLTGVFLPRHAVDGAT